MVCVHFILVVLALADISKRCIATQDVCTIGCHSVVSALSGMADDVKTQIQCADGEVMTGCSSYSPGSGHGNRDGEYFEEDDNGDIICVAQNGYRGTGVYAYARCCNWPNMACEYIKGNKSTTDTDGGSVAECPSTINCMETSVTGCSVKSGWKKISGTRSDMPSQCRGYNEGGSRGVYAHAACCTAPGLTCIVLSSEQSGINVGDTARVRCPTGYMMTGCNIRSLLQMTDGAYIDDDDTCVAVNGGSIRGVWASANCCKST